MKKRKKVGFTITELLAVIVIMAILSSIAAGLIINYVKEGEKTYNSKIIDQVIIAGKNYFADNKAEIPITGENKEVVLNALSSEGYLSKDVINAAGNKCMENSYVIAARCNNETKYYACVQCPKKDGSGLEALEGSVCDISKVSCEDQKDKQFTIIYNLKDPSKTDGSYKVTKSCTDGTQVKLSDYSDFANKASGYNYEYWFNNTENLRTTSVLCNKDYNLEAKKTEIKKEGRVYLDNCGNDTNIISNIGTSSETSKRDDDTKTIKTINNMSYTNGKSFTIPANPYSRPGFTFLGWSKSKCGTELKDVNYNENETVTNLGDTSGSDVTLHAVWQKDYIGVANGTYSPGTTITYADRSWTVIYDYGNYVGLAANTSAGSGNYTNSKSNLKTNIANGNAIISHDIANRGMYLLDSSNYVDSNSGYKGTVGNFTADTLYWTKSGYVSSSTAIKKYSVSEVTWASGYFYQTNYKYSTRDYNTKLNTSNAYAANANISCSNSNTSLSITNGKYSTGTSSLPLAESYMRFHITGGNSNTVKMDRTVVDLSHNITTSKSSLSNKKWVFKICGGSYNGKTITVSAKSSSKYNFSFPHTKQKSGPYGSGAKYITLAGSVTSTVSSGTRTYNLYGSDSCKKRTTYSVGNVSKTIYYRPHIVVREAP